MFALPYNNKGCMHLLVFDIKSKIVDFDVMSTFGYTFKAMPIQCLFNPLSACSFISDDKIAYSFFHKKQMNHYHFIFNLKT